MNRPDIRLFVNREIRRVPLDWEHPKDERGWPIPLYPYPSPDEFQELLADSVTLDELASDYMPDFSSVPEEQLGICAYETTSEGCPISPVFPDTPEGRWALVH